MARFLLLVLPMAMGRNLVLNGGMESLSHWECGGFSCQLTTDHHRGHHAINVTGRNETWHGPSQVIKGIQPNGRYKVDGYVKLLNDQTGQIGQTVELEIAVNFINGQSTYLTAASHPLARSSDGWIHITGDFNAPSENISDAQIYYQGPSPVINFVTDDVSVTPMIISTHWKTDSDNVINRIRKSDINFLFTFASHIRATQVEVDVIQTKKSFPFGTAVACDEYLHGNSHYQDFINKHFNWAVTENALKWDIMEPQKGNISYNLPIEAIKKLKSHGIHVRGHNIVWSVDDAVPEWVRPLTGDTLKKTVKHRIQDIVGRTKTLVEHWDVNNENLHGFWFQNKLNDRNYDLEIFRTAHQAGPHVKLFLNDYDVVASGGFTGAYRQQAIRIKNSHVGLYGVGVECHFEPNQYPDPSLIKLHLDTIAQAKVPVWVTELDVVNNDPKKRADWYETALRAFYGHTAVQGIMLWGFWSKRHWRGEAAALVSGENFTINAGGNRFLDLVERQWMTRETYTLSANQLRVRGYHGDYEIRVKVNGHEVTSLRQHFTLGKSSHSVTIHVHS